MKESTAPQTLDMLENSRLAVEMLKARWRRGRRRRVCWPATQGREVVHDIQRISPTGRSCCPQRTAEWCAELVVLDPGTPF
ncbi:MAG: hypothetical protein H6656_15410 [Ardenticatenaceae bacterium]|nr:hypothetical protein [Ardenticatenaceae bacterium]